LRARGSGHIFLARLKLILTSIRSMLKRLFARKPAPPAPGRCAECPLAACANGCKAAVLRMECEHGEAHRLRGMGLFEGSREACSTRATGCCWR
jgi:hypothetical protein